METQDITKFVKIAKYTGLAIIIAILLISSIGSVGTGYMGVKTRFGAVTGATVSPGLYMKLPFIEKVTKINVQTQKEQANAGAASKDLQNVSSVVAVNYSIDSSKIVWLYSNLGKNFKETVIDPSIQEAVKATTSKFTAEELITKRELVSDEITKDLKDKLEPLGIFVSNISIVDFDFSQSFNQAIEAKVTAEQNALAAKNKLEQVKYEAQQAIEEATGKAKALQIEGQALSQNPAVKELRAIEKWNGVLPQVTGSATPFINLK